MNRCFGYLSTLLMMLISGCGPAPEVRPELQPASGSLTINGKPADGAFLILHPIGDEFDELETRPRASVKPDGSFELTTYQQGDGAPVGDYQVAVLWFDDPDSNQPWDRLAGRYAKPESTNIQLSITEGTDQLGPIVIEDAQIRDRPRQKKLVDHDQVD